MVAVRVLCFIGMLGLGTLRANQLEAVPPPNVMHTFDARTVRAVQGALRQRHYYFEQVDGFFGTATGHAIVRFQIDHGLPVIPAITGSLLVALGITNR
jgi:peptidoglycan hydrolase-like protein with peptidoglycan-binding domain